MMNKIALGFAILLYCLLSSPTPDAVTWVEYAIAGLLIVSVGFMGAVHAISSADYPPFLQYHRIFFGVMLIVPTIVGVMNGHEVTDIIRDVIPVLFLILPLVYYDRDFDGLSTLLMIGGGLFAARYIMPLFTEIPYITDSKSELLYLANAPLVCFAAIYGFYKAVEVAPTSWIVRILAIAISLICFAAMILMMQRAPVALSLISCVVILAFQARQTPIRTIIILVFIGSICAMFYPVIAQTIGGFYTKNMTVGWNSRIEEFTRVMDQASWLGTGWGGLWQSPAVGDIWVRFTHSMMSYYWLKAGIAGLIGVVPFIAIWLYRVFKAMKVDFGTGLAIAVPLCIHMMLYTGFKTLDFALLLTLLVTICPRKQS